MSPCIIEVEIDGEEGALFGASRMTALVIKPSSQGPSSRGKCIVTSLWICGWNCEAQI